MSITTSPLSASQSAKYLGGFGANFVKCFCCSSILPAKIYPTSIFLDNTCFKRKTAVSLRPASVIHLIP